MKLSVNIHVAKLTGYYGLGTVLLFNTFGFYNLPSARKVSGPFKKWATGEREEGNSWVLFLPLPPFYACLITLPKFFELLTCACWRKSIGAARKGTLNLAYYIVAKC